MEVEPWHRLGLELNLATGPSEGWSNVQVGNTICNFAGWGQH
jgi:hypothetical protein